MGRRFFAESDEARERVAREILTATDDLIVDEDERQTGVAFNVQSFHDSRSRDERSRLLREVESFYYHTLRLQPFEVGGETG